MSWLQLVLAAIAIQPTSCSSSPPLQVFAFGSGNNWMHYDWNVLTSYVPTESAQGLHLISPALIKHAHQHNAKIIPFAPGNATAGQISVPLTANRTVRTLWINKTVNDLVKYSLDGVNFDVELPMNASDPRIGWYTDLVRETTLKIHAAIPGGQVSVDVGKNKHWSHFTILWTIL